MTLPATLSRRHFLGLMAAASVTALHMTLPTLQSARAQPARSAIIVGAGAAGLAAARLLQAAGWNVIVLEGRSRIGGRVWTDRSLSGVPLDLGASWVHGVDGNPLTELVRQYGIRTVPSDLDNVIAYAADGERLSERFVRQIDDTFEELIDALDEYRETLDRDMALGAAFEQLLADWDLSDEERHALRAWANTSIEHEYAADMDDLSLWWWDNDQTFGGGDVVFPEGYDQVIQALAQGLDIRLDHVVQSVDYGPQGVTVGTSQGSFAADRAVITLPLGVLKSGAVQFDPPLPEAKQQAISRLEMGVLNKVYLRFPAVFWDREAEWIDYVGERTGEWAESLNIHAYTGEPVLVMFNAGEFGLALEQLTDAEILAQAMTVLRTLYGTDIPEPDGVLITRWGRDPFALGSYSSMGVGATPDDRQALAEPIAGTVFFAGEATSVDYAATVHGALLSGRRAAEELLASP